jgi:alkyldihydroxyacetonephosphate synthase
LKQNLKWWGWGLEEQTYAIPDPQGFWSFFERTLGPLPQAHRISSLDEIPLQPPRLTTDDLLALEVLFSENSVSTDPVDRLCHSLGKSYVDLWRIRQGQIETVPDAVIFPEKEEDIKSLLDLGADRGWVIIPFGGGTSVVGGIEPPVGNRPVLSLDLRRLDRILSIDQESGIACIQAGIRGPELEAELNASGFTLGHFPQSFEYSTLGGWIATRGAGQSSTKYGKIEQMVVSIRMITPAGVFDSPVVPGDAVGPSLLQCLVGSEGAFGVITRAVVRLHPVPKHRSFSCYLFSDFSTGVDAVRQILQANIYPAVVRLSDPDEVLMALLLSKTPRPSLKQHLAEWYVKFRGFELNKSALLMLTFEGSHSQVSAARRQARRFLNPGLNIGPHPARLWMKSRFQQPYLRDLLLDRSVMVDTLETAAPWDKLPELYAAVRQTLVQSTLRTAPGALVLCHLSHAYQDGASLYFIFMARQQLGNELEQWQSVKTAATEAILKYGGALSHHHGVGTMHKPWIGHYLGLEGLHVLDHLKSTLDPDNIMNPGKLMGK